jgi:RHS repeat-associated protein
MDGCSVANRIVMDTHWHDGNGRRVKSTVNGETILFAGGHFEFNDTTNEVTKYYFGGASVIAVRKYIIPQSQTLNYLLGDHLGSTSIVTDDTGSLIMETRYKPWGEVRYTTPNMTLPTRYTFTGQYSYVNDDATDLGGAGFGLMFYNARWYDPALGRFAQADTIVPGGVQGLDRYAAMNNNPVRYVDPSGHRSCTTPQANTGDETCFQNIWKEYKKEKQKELDDYTGYSKDKDKERQMFAPDIPGEIAVPQSDAELWLFVAAGDLVVKTIIEKDLGAGCSCNDLASSVFGITDLNGNGLIDFEEYTSILDYSFFISQDTVIVIFTRVNDDAMTPLHAALIVSVNQADPENSILIQTNSGDAERGVFFTTIADNPFRTWSNGSPSQLIFLQYAR